MFRLIRIALTLFLSAGILFYLTFQRELRLKQAMDSGIADDFAAKETEMISMGVTLSGILVLIGVILMVIAFVKRGKKPTQHDG